MVFKRLLSLFVFFAFGSFANAQGLTTNIVIAGSTDSLSFNAAIAPTSQFLNNGSKLWMAIVQGNQVYFFSDTQGFVPYAGGLGMLLSGAPTEAPEVRTITRSTEVINLTGWNTRSILGSDVYIGYGSTFAELVKSARYTKLYTLQEKAASVDASQAAFYCSNPYTYIVVNYVSIQFLVTNYTNYPISRINFDSKLTVPGRPLQIAGSMYYDIPGGLAAGASIFLKLQPNMFDDFAVQAQSFCGISASTTLNLKITSVVDGSGKSHRY